MRSPCRCPSLTTLLLSIVTAAAILFCIQLHTQVSELHRVLATDRAVLGQFVDTFLSQEGSRFVEFARSDHDRMRRVLAWKEAASIINVSSNTSLWQHLTIDEIPRVSGLARQLEQVQHAFSALQLAVGRSTANLTRNGVALAHIDADDDCEGGGGTSKPAVKIEKSESECSPCPSYDPQPDLSSSHLQKRNQTIHIREIPTMALQGIPIVGDGRHPWRQEMIGSNQTRPVFLVSADPKIESGNLESCNYIDVHFMHTGSISDDMRGRCTMLVPDRAVSSHVLTVKMNSSSSTALPLHEINLRGRKDPLFGPFRDEKIEKFLHSKQSMVKLAISLLRRAGHSSTNIPIVVMCVNDGHLPLLINWACGLRANNIDIPPNLIFVTTPELRRRINGLGFTAFYHEALGDGHSPTKPANTSVNRVLGDMMYLKQYSVLVALQTRHDILYQDVDVIWLADPIPSLLNMSAFYHAQWQDERSRKMRFAPYFANSGFVYLKYCELTVWFWEQLTYALPQWPAGNQKIVAGILELFVKRYGLSTWTIPFKEYTAGGSVRHSTDTSRHINLKSPFPEVKVVHFSRTRNLEEKVKQIQLHKQLFVSEACMYNISECFSNKKVELVGNRSFDWLSSFCGVPKGTLPQAMLL